MNEVHLQICSSPEWRAVVEEEILPNAVGDRSLGGIVLEVGAGPGGLLVGSDSVDTPARRELHEGDVFNPVDPETLPGRLRGAGFVDVSLQRENKVLRDRFYFWARAPEAP